VRNDCGERATRDGRRGAPARNDGAALRDWLSGACRAWSAVFASDGFPGDVCISVNDEVVHGIPGIA